MFQLIIEKLIPLLLFSLTLLPRNVSTSDHSTKKSSEISELHTDAHHLNASEDSLLTLKFESGSGSNKTQRENSSDAGTSERNNQTEFLLPTFSARKGHLTDLFLQNRSSTYPKLKGSPRNVKIKAPTKNEKKEIKTISTKDEGDLVDFIIGQMSKLNPLQPLNLTKEDLKDLLVVEDIKHLLPESNLTLTNSLRETIENIETNRKKRLLVHQLPERPIGSYYNDFADYYNTNPSLYDQSQQVSLRFS